MSDTQKKLALPKDGMALVLGGLFILTLVFIAYRYFNKPLTPETSKEDTSLLDLFDEEKTDDKSDKLNGKGAKVERPLGTGGSLNNDASEDVTGWVANDYKEGDIIGKTHTVVAGDTLWEIAEAVYGDGAQWTKILDANSSSVGFLANGQQALIQVGQTLTIPS